MKFDIPKITRQVELGEYAAEYEGRVIYVWVNPPARLLEEHDRLIEEVNRMVREVAQEPAVDSRNALVDKINQRLDGCASELAKVFCELWSQGPADTRWTEEEIRDLVKETNEIEPRLWSWLRNESIKAIRNYRAGVKKN